MAVKTIWDEASDAFDLAIGYDGEIDNKDYPSGSIIWADERRTIQLAVTRGRKLECAIGLMLRDMWCAAAVELARTGPTKG